MLTSILDVPPVLPGTRIAYGRGEFQFGELPVPSGSVPHPVDIVIHGVYWRVRYDLTHIGQAKQNSIALRCLVVLASVIAATFVRPDGRWTQ
jgi:hypothetical protein